MSMEQMPLNYSAARIGFQRRLQLSIQGFLVVILLITQQWILHEFERNALDSAAERARTVADGAINGLNTLMVTKVDDEEVIRNKKSRALFIKKMGSSENIEEMRIIRGPNVDREYPNGLPQEQPTDDIDRKVLETGHLEISRTNDGNALRMVVPFIAQKNFRGSNCLNCHEVEEGAVLGAASVVIDTHDTLAYISRISQLLWFGQLLLQIVLFFVIGWIVKRALAKLGGEPDYVISIVERIAQGNLSGEVVLHQDDRSSLLAAMKKMQDGLKEMIQNNRHTAESLIHAADCLGESSRKMLNASEAESNASSSVAASVQQITSYVSEISQNSAQAKQYAEETRTSANDGTSIVRQVISEIGQISVAVTAASDQILTLGEKSRQISSIVSVIKEIAEQTNLLALNAAIEAARAGEQGRGFAVVADEVRKLAERTTVATQQVANMVDAIQTGTVEAVTSMSKGRDLVDGGVALAGHSGESMESIQREANKVLQAVGEISTSLQEHTITSDQLAESINKIARMTDETRLVSQDVAGSADELKLLATILNDHVRKFKL